MSPNVSTSVLTRSLVHLLSHLGDYENTNYLSGLDDGLDIHLPDKRLCVNLLSWMFILVVSQGINLPPVLLLVGPTSPLSWAQWESPLSQVKTEIVNDLLTEVVSEYEKLGVKGKTILSLLL